MAEQTTKQAPTPVVVVRPTAPITPWSDKITKVRVTPARGRNTVMFRGKPVTQDAELSAPGDLEELAQLSATGDYVIEKYNKDGVEVNSQGEPLKTLSRNAPPQVTQKDLNAIQAKAAAANADKAGKE